MFSDELLSSTFALSTLGNSVIAIVSGFLASGAAFAMGYVGPFMVATGILIASSVVVFTSWSENFGDSSIQVQESIQKALNTVKSGTSLLVAVSAFSVSNLGLPGRFSYYSSWYCSVIV